jgi:hypothetical protein
MQGSLGIERMCELAKVSRAGFYRLLQEQRPQEEDTGCDRPSRRSRWDTAAAMAIDALPSS